MVQVTRPTAQESDRDTRKVGKKCCKGEKGHGQGVYIAKHWQSSVWSDNQADHHVRVDSANAFYASLRQKNRTFQTGYFFMHHSLPSTFNRICLCRTFLRVIYSTCNRYGYSYLGCIVVVITKLACIAGQSLWINEEVTK